MVLISKEFHHIMHDLSLERIRDAFSIRSQKEVLRVIMSNILKLFCQGKSWTSHKPFYPAKLTVLVYRNQQRRDS
ncbi:hypothetical protein DPMN_094456 [Dreissena polymorpha]|uniref:Uncharacterized protein n=1 Tax=Dreissena polymorpha TaxID=45954 RepID=A0A9D4R2P2_DREPO|nr:hypothetical protein DPMN_094456 [Dreissena polymorpha]